MSSDDEDNAVETTTTTTTTTTGRGRGRGSGRAVVAAASTATAMDVEADEPPKAIDICPADKRRQRACLCCGLVKTFDQFVSHGCNNCDGFLHLRGDEALVSFCTTGNFFGIVSMINPNGSWAARWQGIDKFKPGCYALRMKGTLPESVIDILPEEIHARYDWLQRDESTGGANPDDQE
jgi:transcription elongation factor SPT4